jgi:hypothetical protein
LTLDCLLANIGDKIFAHGHVYTALSRARSLKSIFLIEFDPDKTNLVDPKVMNFYLNHIQTARRKRGRDGRDGRDAGAAVATVTSTYETTRGIPDGVSRSVQ